MDFAFIYLIQRFFYRFFGFFRNWYVDGSRFIGHAFISVLTEMDKSFAVEITLRHFFEPLYKDYSIVGRVLGIIFRSIRVIIGSVIYFLVAIAFLFFFLLWISIPVILITYVIRG